MPATATATVAPSARAQPVLINCRIICETCYRPAPGDHFTGSATIHRRRMMQAATAAGWAILKSGAARCPLHRKTTQELTGWLPKTR